MKRLLAVLGILCLGWMTAAGRAAEPPATNAPAADLAAIQGRWRLTAGERDGAAFTPEFMTNSTRVATGNQTTVTIRGQLIMKARFTLNPAKRPKEIDYDVSGGPYSGAIQWGIYEITGDEVKFCFSTPGEKRPANFKTQKGDGKTVSVWTREKPATP